MPATIPSTWNSLVVEAAVSRVSTVKRSPRVTTSVTVEWVSTSTPCSR